MSILTMDLSDPNMASASAFVSSVFPTPVGPRNMNEPIGLFGSFKPTLALLTALEIDFTASSCPITLLWSMDSRFRSLSDSFSVSFFTGTFVHLETTCAISSSPTTRLLTEVLPDFQFFLESSRSFFSSFSRSRSFAAFS